MRRVIGLAVAGVVSVSLVAGCGGEARPVAKGSATASPARILSLTEVSALFEQRMKADKTVLAALNMEGSDGPMNGSLVLRDSGGAAYDLHLSTTSPGDDGKSEELEGVLTADASFIKLDEPTEPGKPWIKVAAGSKNPMAQLMSVTVSIFRMIGDVRQQMSLVAAGGRLIKTAPEQVTGLNTIRYTATVNMEQAIDKIDIASFARTQVPPELLELLKIDPADLDSAAARKQLPRIREELKKRYAGVTTTTDVWVDDSGHPVKYVFTSPTSAKDEGGTVEMIFSNWGNAPFELPPADQVTDLTDVDFPES